MVVEQALITTVFFDWDHTLAYTRTPNNTVGERLAEMFRLADLPYTQEEIEQALKQFDEAVQNGELPAVIYPQKRREIAQVYGYLFDFLGEKDKSWPVMERLYGTYALLPTYLYEDSRPTLSQLRRRGYELGIISNHSRSARPVIEELVGDLVPSRQIIISEEIGVHKPAKTIFKQACRRVHRRPGECLLIGDNLIVDAIGSVTKGGYGLGVWLDRQNKGMDQPLPDHVKRVTALVQLPELLEGGKKASKRHASKRKKPAVCWPD